MAISFLLTGCSTLSQRASRTASRESIFRAYQKQNYEDCLTQIEQLRTAKSSKNEKAELLLIEGMCREEMNQGPEADRLYRTILQLFPNSSSVAQAARRLTRSESDEREHFSITFAPGSWERIDKEWNDTNLRERYLSKEDSRESIIILARDIGFERISVGSALAQTRATLEFDAQQVKFKIIQEDKEDAFFEFTASNPGSTDRETINGEVNYGMKIRRSSGVGRVLLTKSRMHVILYSNTATLDAAQKTKWLENLKSARLESHG